MLCFFVDLPVVVCCVLYQIVHAFVSVIVHVVFIMCLCSLRFNMFQLFLYFEFLIALLSDL